MNFLALRALLAQCALPGVFAVIMRSCARSFESAQCINGGHGAQCHGQGPVLRCVMHEVRRGTDTCPQHEGGVPVPAACTVLAPCPAESSEKKLCFFSPSNSKKKSFISELRGGSSQSFAPTRRSPGKVPSYRQTSDFRQAGSLLY